ncbi:hypothetical protein DPMN_043583 [Dreissena polymorpha]|uniref:Uncharacterized protein n=1 Tax=Dreissena polymorpha TaxID=45954 RepID=A0A9D4D2N0_DREPO|nr:hypothetical protein DPMN_043583 [Dreissena polymorpha]
MTIFELVRDIYKIDAKNVTSRVKMTPHPGCHVFLPFRTIFELNRHIQETHVLAKFHEDWTKNVTSKKTAPPPGGHIFLPIWTIFELVRDIKETNVLTKFHNNWTKIVTFRVNTAPPPGGHTKLHEDLGSHVTSTVFTGFELSRGINETNVLTKFHEDRTINVASGLRSEAKTIFELVQDIIGTNLLTKFHEDRKINEASRVSTRKNAPPPHHHVFQPKGIIFEIA